MNGASAVPNRIIPNGAKIKALREAQNLKQQDCARRTYISERTLRNIETKNAPTSQQNLQAIATLLEVTIDELVLNTKQQASVESQGGSKPRMWRHSFELHYTTSASKLLEEFGFLRRFTFMDYDIRDDITTKEARFIETILKIVHRITGCHFYTPFGGYELDENPLDPDHHRGWFSQLHQRAHLQESIEALQSAGVFVFVGKYLRTDWRDSKKDSTTNTTIVQISFRKREASSVTDEYDPGLVFDSETQKYVDRHGWLETR